MLHDSRVEANIPAGDLQRARDFYADKLGLTPTAEYDGVWLQYATTGGTTFNIGQTEYAGKAGHTIAQWHVNDIKACLLYTSDAADEEDSVDLGGRRIIKKKK